MVVLQACVASCLVGEVYVEHISELLAFVGKYATCSVLYTESEPLLVKLD